VGCRRGTLPIGICDRDGSARAAFRSRTQLSNQADGRSNPPPTDREQDWICYAVGGSPAPIRPDWHSRYFENDCLTWLVSGINYGENVATDISCQERSVRPLEAAAHGVLSLAVSLELENGEWYSYSRKINFSTAAYFTYRFARILLETPCQPIQPLNLKHPRPRHPRTPWKVTRVSRNRYFIPFPNRIRSEDAGKVDSKVFFDPDDPSDVGSDVHALKVEKVVSVSPLSLDMTSRVDLQQLQASFGKAQIVHGFHKFFYNIWGNFG